MGLPVAASRIVGRKSTGDTDDLTSAEVLAILFPAGFDFDGFDGSSPVRFRITAVDGQTAPVVEILRGDLSPAMELLVVTGSNPAEPTESGFQLIDVQYGPNPADGASVFHRAVARPPGDTTDDFMVYSSMGAYADNAGFSIANVLAAGPAARTFPEYGERAELIFDAGGARLYIKGGDSQTGNFVEVYDFDGTQYFYVRPNGRMYDFAPDEAIHPTEMPSGGGLTRRWTNSTKRLTLAIKATDGSMWSVDIPSAASTGGVAGALLLATTTDVAATVSDTAYDATSWNGVTTVAPSKNAVRDQVELLVPKSVVDAAGDLIVGTADNTVGRLGIGSSLQALRVNSGATALEWADAAGGNPGGVLLDSEGTATVGNPASFDQQFAIATLDIPTNTPAGARLGFSISMLGTTNTTACLGELFIGSSVTSGTAVGLAANLDLRTWVWFGEIIVRGTSDLVVEHHAIKCDTNGAAFGGATASPVGATVTSTDITSAKSLFLRGKVGSGTANQFVCTRHESSLWRIA